MGVKGLWELVAPVGRRVSMDTVANKTLAIDVSIWLTQFLYAMRDSDGELLRNAHLLGILRRCCKLIFYNVKPIFVFDGATPQLKRRTLVSRRDQRNKQKLRLRRLAEKILLNELKLRKLREKKEDEPEVTGENISVQVDSRCLYDQYMDRVLRDSLKKNNPEAKENAQEEAEQLNTEVCDKNSENRDEILVESDSEAGFKINQENEEEDKDGTPDSLQNVYSTEKEEYEVPDISQMSPEALASMPPEMFETIVSEIRNRERSLHRDQFLKVEDNPADFSQKQLEGFLRLSMTKKEVMKARAASFSHQGHGGRRIASDPGKNYSLTKISDSVSENGSFQQSSSEYQCHVRFQTENSIENNCNNADEGLNWTKSVSDPEQHRISSLNSLELKNEASSIIDGFVNNECFSQTTPEEDEDVQWVACPLESEDKFVQQDSKLCKEDNVNGIQHQDNSISADFIGCLNENNTEEDCITATSIQSAIYSSLVNEHDVKQDIESCIQTSEKNHLEDISKFLVWNSNEMGETLNLRSRQDNAGNDLYKLDSGMTLQVNEEEYQSSSSFGNDIETRWEEEFLDQEDIATGASEDFVLPDEKLENLFQEFENERKELHQEYTHLKSGSDIITDEMYEEIRYLLRLLGIPYIQAPMEAEAQCAYFNQVGLVEGVVTEDSDAFLFGARTVFRNIFEDKKDVEQYEMDDIERYLGLDREKLILLSLLLGSDYTQGIHGVGVVNATEIIRAFPSFEQLKEFARWANRLSLEEERYKLDPEDPNFVKNEFFLKHRKMKRNWVIHDSFPNKHVIDAYSYPMVDTNSIEFCCQRPNVSKLVEFCRAKFGWDSEKVKKLVIPVLKAYDARNQSQTRIEQYFHPMRFAKIKSKRLENAVRGITSAVDEEMFLSKTSHVKNDGNSETEANVEVKKKRKKSIKDKRQKSYRIENNG